MDTDSSDSSGSESCYDGDIDYLDSQTCADNVNSKADRTKISYIGKGAYGKVFRINDYAIKQFPSCRTQVFIREAFMMRYMKGISGVLQPSSFMVRSQSIIMPYIPRTLHNWMDRGPENSYELRQSVFIKILIAMLYIHERRIVHADVKPENIMVFPDKDATLQVYIIDWSLSGPEGYSSTQCSPALYREIDHRNDCLHDVYGLGILAFELFLFIDFKKVPKVDEVRRHTSRLEEPWRTAVSYMTRMREERWTIREVLEYLRDTVEISVDDKVLINNALCEPLWHPHEKRVPVSTSFDLWLNRRILSDHISNADGYMQMLYRWIGTSAYSLTWPLIVSSLLIWNSLHFIPGRNFFGLLNAITTINDHCGDGHNVLVNTIQRLLKEDVFNSILFSHTTTQ